jgi:nitrogenase-associated protein
MWFNPNSPRVKSGEIDPSAHNSANTLNLMLEDHLLIRRPLMQAGVRRMCGFDPAKVHAWVGLASPEEAKANSTNFQTCSQTSSSKDPAKCP